MALACRACFTSQDNMKMLTIGKGKLLKTYELLANTKLKPINGLPQEITLCNICVSQLQRYSRLMDLARNTDTNGSENLGIKHSMFVVQILDTFYTSIYKCGYETNVKDTETACVSEIKVIHEVPIIIANPNKMDIVEIKPTIDKESSVQYEFEIATYENESKVDKNYGCKRCGRKLRSEMILKRHKCRGQNGNLHDCPLCEKKILFKHLIKHLLTHACEKKHPCPKCNKTFKYEKCFATHLQTHTNDDESQHICPRCGENFRSEKSMKKHFKVHANQYTCPLCDNKYNSENLFIQHLPFHGHMNHTCPLCEKSFKYNKSLVNHLQSHAKQYKIHHNQNDGSKIESHLNLHQQIKVEPLFVPETSSTVVTHANSTDIDLPILHPFVCDWCDKTYKQIKTFLNHLETHRGQPYSCKRCSDQYIEKSDLRHHFIFQCLRKKRYICDMCLKSYNSKHMLAQHISSHCYMVYQDTKKLYICDTCGNKYNLKREIIEHIKTEEPCNKSGPIKSQLPVRYSTKRYTCCKCTATFEKTCEWATHLVKYHKYPCDSCDETFKTKAALYNHTKVHKIYKCRECPVTFKTTKKMTHHLINYHKMYICDCCHKTFKTRTSLNNHIKIHEIHSCSDCNATFKTEKELTQHLIKKHTYVCRPCGNKFVTKLAFSDHSKSCSKLLKCSKCTEKFVSSILLNKHLQKVHKYPCDRCDETFSSKMALKSHIHLHDKPHACSKCSASFKTLVEFTEHNSQCYNGETFASILPLQSHIRHNIPCSKCTAAFTTMDELTEHMEKQHNVICDAKFQLENYSRCTECDTEILTLHERKKHFTNFHMNICNICGHTYTTHQELNKHIECVHRKQTCKECGEKFISRFELKKHSIQKHSAAHTCKICKQTFKVEMDYQNHILIHISEKPHVCLKCDETFARKWELGLHNNVHVGEKLYNCKKCGNIFGQKHWYKHMEFHIANDSNC